MPNVHGLIEESYSKGLTPQQCLNMLLKEYPHIEMPEMATIRRIYKQKEKYDGF